MRGSGPYEVLARIQDDLRSNPFRGDLVKGAGGLRKARVANPRRQKGSRGGLRYLFLYLPERQHIHLIYLLDKGEQEDLTADERKRVAELVTWIKRGR